MDAIYRDIAERTDGDIYIGVVGPVRTGKSTFIKKFMDLLVIPNIEGDFKKERAQDELPQSAAGRTIMTTEPKFVPNDAVPIKIGGNAGFNVRLIDCVGYMVPAALGSMENGQLRMVKTPWSEEELPFDRAAEMGTQKVIKEHSTIGIVVTTDGSITDIERDNYKEAERRVITELQELRKPFIVILNSTMPHGPECLAVKEELEKAYGVSVIPMNCAQMDSNDINVIMEGVLFEFPLSEVSVSLPSWVDSLNDTHYIKTEITNAIREGISKIERVRDTDILIKALEECKYTDTVSTADIDLGCGKISVLVTATPELFYTVLSEETGFDIKSEGALMTTMRELAFAKQKFDKLEFALHQVNETGYGIVSPSIDELTLEEPEIIKQGGKFGVRLRASAPSIHMIRADIETEVNPIVGTEKQSEELVRYLLSEFEVDPKKIWESNLFGKSLHELVNEGLHNKLSHMPQAAQSKLQETLERIINEGSGGLICIIL